MTFNNIESSNLAAVGYDAQAGVLVIQFHGGRLYEYANVPPSQYDDLMRAQSHGHYFHQHIRHRYPSRRHHSYPATPHRHE